MFKSQHSDQRSSAKKGQKMENFESQSKKQKMKPVKKDKYRPSAQYQDDDLDD
jgi:hypothetical protein